MCKRFGSKAQENTHSGRKKRGRNNSDRRTGQILESNTEITVMGLCARY